MQWAKEKGEFFLTTKIVIPKSSFTDNGLKENRVLTIDPEWRVVSVDEYCELLRVFETRKRNFTFPLDEGMTLEEVKALIEKIRPEINALIKGYTIYSSGGIIYGKLSESAEKAIQIIAEKMQIGKEKGEEKNK